eukprot:m.512083 g.512083  ORF g.512083 m.512083 type:complete len:321 (+) comp21892_c1_seq71:2226-3188(+)
MKDPGKCLPPIGSVPPCVCHWWELLTCAVSQAELHQRLPNMSDRVGAAEMATLTRRFFTPVGPAEVFQRMCRNLVAIHQGFNMEFSDVVGDILEFSRAFRTEEFEPLMHLMLAKNLAVREMPLKAQEVLADITAACGHSASFGLLERNLQNLRESIDRILESQQRTVKQRTAMAVHCDGQDTAPYVGALCRHRRYNYTCVVRGWDAECLAPSQWQIQMGVHHLAKGPKQPFFLVSASDGSERYAAFESLEVISGGAMSPEHVRTHVQLLLSQHPTLGRYFTRVRWEHGSFEMCNEMQRLYPDDVPLGCTQQVDAPTHTAQ